MNQEKADLNEPTDCLDLDCRAAKTLRWFLAVVGCGLMVATFAIFLPAKTMGIIHGWLGLGDFPAQPITMYLARSTSLLYAIHGSLMLFVSFDMKRYWPLIQMFGWLHVVIGLAMFGIDLSAPMPLYWIAGEGIPIAIAGGAIVWLWRLSHRN